MLGDTTDPTFLTALESEELERVACGHQFIGGYDTKLGKRESDKSSKVAKEFGLVNYCLEWNTWET